MRLGLFVLFAASTFGQAKPDAAEILAKVKDTWKDLKTYDLNLEIRLGDPSGAEQREGLRVAASIGPDRYRVVYGGLPGAETTATDGTMIYDGATFWVYLPLRNEYRMGPMAPDKLGRDAKPEKVNTDTGIGQYMQLVGRFNGSHLLREESLSIDGGKADCFVIEKDAGGKMWIDKRNYHVLRAEEVDADGSTSTAVIRIKLNEPLSDDLFKFAPPPGARNLGTP
jgi:outer membrane lipoprotein-sorting protein